MLGSVFPVYWSRIVQKALSKPGKGTRSVLAGTYVCDGPDELLNLGKVRVLLVSYL